jgi:hypothetical protein
MEKQNDNLFVEKTIRLHIPVNMSGQPLRFLKDNFVCEAQAAGSDLLVIYARKAEPDYERVIIQTGENPDNREN